jgi:phage-related baseplate assembly protein
VRIATVVLLLELLLLPACPTRKAFVSYGAHGTKSVYNQLTRQASSSAIDLRLSGSEGFRVAEIVIEVLSLMLVERGSASRAREY